MTERTTTTTATLPKSTSTIGIDLGDRKSHVCVLDAGGQVIEEGADGGSVLGVGAGGADDGFGAVRSGRPRRSRRS